MPVGGGQGRLWRLVGKELRREGGGLVAIRAVSGPATVMTHLACIPNGTLLHSAQLLTRAHSALFRE